MDGADALVIGGGFYGCITALEIAALGRSVRLVEAEPQLLGRASYANQARIHQGYHYPRSLLTALRSRRNFAGFVDEFPECVDDDFAKYYAVAARFSKVSAAQFHNFCLRIGAPIEEAPAAVADLFDPRRIEAVFRVKEFAFNAAALRTCMIDRLRDAGVHVRCSAAARRIVPEGGALIVEFADQDNATFRHVFNCTYSNINGLLQRSGLERIPLKHEYAEIALVELPQHLRGLGITVMDGPFFSTMPFPDAGLHSFSHVRYTPHYYWTDRRDGDWIDPVAQFRTGRPESRVRHMLRDAARYVPSVENARYVRSLWEIKTVLPRSEGDDSRPILFQPAAAALPHFVSIMGGKIDNIIDIREQLNAYFRNAHAAP